MSARRVRLCLQDLYHQDVVEMIERETRQFELWEIVEPEDPAFAEAYALLWRAFGPSGEIERDDALRTFLQQDPFQPREDGTFLRYVLLLAKDHEGRVRGVRDASVLYNPAYDPSLVLIYLSHIYMLPEARGTVLSYWLRIAPVEIAHDYVVALHKRGLITLPLPDRPGQRFGLRFNLCAEMEYFCPLERQSWQRILFYGRGGFDVIHPRDFPYAQPDFRDPQLIATTGTQPLPLIWKSTKAPRALRLVYSVTNAKQYATLAGCAPGGSMRRAVTVKLTDSEREELELYVRAGKTPQRLVQRAEVVLLAADGKTNETISVEVGLGLAAVGKWRRRFAARRMDGILRDQPGRGRKPTYLSEKIDEVIRLTTTAVPPGRTHWSRSTMATAGGISESTVGRIWRDHGLTPHRVEFFKLSKDKAFAAKVEDVVGLYLSPPENAAVFCIDEKSQIQALDRTQPGLPLKKGRAGTMTP